MRAYLLRILVQLDTLVMTVFNGRRNETMSAAAWSLEQDGKLLGRIFRPVIDAFFFFDPNHCACSWLNERPSK